MPPPAAASQPSSTPDAQTAAEPAPDDAAIAAMLKPWTGDLDGLVKRRYIRLLVTFSKTNYFLDGPTQRGATYDGAKLFETFLNDRLKSKTIHVQIAFIPVSRDRIFDALAEGEGDIAAANLTITPERQKKVDFSLPVADDVREVVVTGAGQPAVNVPEDLSGRKVHVRRSSSYYASLTALNESLKKSGKAPVEVVAAPEPLEDEDLLEMVNAGLIPATIVDNHVAGLWKQVFDQLQVSDAAVRTGGQIAWAVRRGTPQLQEALNAFIKKNLKGSLSLQHDREAILREHEMGEEFGERERAAQVQGNGCPVPAIRRSLQLPVAAARGAGVSGIHHRPEQAQSRRSGGCHADQAGDRRWQSHQHQGCRQERRA